LRYASGTDVLKMIAELHQEHRRRRRRGGGAIRITLGPPADCATGPVSTLEAEARSPSVTHTVSMRKVEDCSNAGAKSPSGRLPKERLGSQVRSR
jgi:hypothetical protein